MIFPEQDSQALWKGVWKLSQMDSSGQTHYHKFPLDRVSQLVDTDYHITPAYH